MQNLGAPTSFAAGHGDDVSDLLQPRRPVVCNQRPRRLRIHGHLNLANPLQGFHIGTSLTLKLILDRACWGGQLHAKRHPACMGQHGC